MFLRWQKPPTMTVAVVCTVPDGVILGVDSAVTIGDSQNPFKVYEDAEKIFQLGTLPIGIAIYGLAGLGQRTIGSYLREFEIVNPSGVLVSGGWQLPAIVEELRAFLMSRYMSTVALDMAAQRGVPFDQIPENERPALGLIVAGFSGGSFLPEVWNIIVPLHAQAGSAVQPIANGALGSAWFASFGPIARYIKGWDVGLLNALAERCAEIKGNALTDDERNSLLDVANQFEYQIVFNAMPVKKGIEYVRFLVQLVISHHKFAVGAAIVGGRPRIGVVTYKGGGFTILDAE